MRILNKPIPSILCRTRYITHRTDLCTMAFPQPVSNDEKLKAVDSVPLFMRSLPGPEEGETNEALSALQSLAYDGTPDGG